LQRLLWAILIVVAVVWGTGVFDRPEPGKPEDSISTEPAVAVPFHPNAVATALRAAPGAIVCPDLNSVSTLFHLYSIHWEESAQDAVTNGQARIIRGEAAPAPDPESFGCKLLTPGTPVSVQNADAFTTGIPMVVARMPDGETFRGVTLPGMLSRQTF
jgi:hypothetical protein